MAKRINKIQEFLDEKVISTQRRIKEATGIDVEPIYYSAGYKDGDDEQQPYNLSKLLTFILRHTKKEKRAVFMQDINKKDEMWEKDDKLEDYQKEIKKSFMESLVESASKGATQGANIGGAIGSLFGKAGEAVGRTVGGVVGGIVGGISSFFGW